MPHGPPKDADRSSLAWAKETCLQARMVHGCIIGTVRYSYYSTRVVGKILRTPAAAQLAVGRAVRAHM